MRITSRLAGVAVLTSVVLAATGCAADTEPVEDATAAGSAIDETAAALVPEAIRESGSITVATAGTLAPAEFVAEGSDEVTGYDIDLIKAIGDVLGLEVSIDNVPFDGIVPGIESGRYDAAISTFAVTKERLKIIDMVSYAQAGGELLVSPELADPPTDLSELCGYSAAALQGSIDLELTEEASVQCEADGDQPIDIKVFPDQNASVLALASGQVDVTVFNSIGAGYTAEQSDGKVVATGTTYNPALLGIAVPKEPGLADAIAAAVKVLLADGTYADILEDWNTTSLAIDESEVSVNPPTDL